MRPLSFCGQVSKFQGFKVSRTDTEDMRALRRTRSRFRYWQARDALLPFGAQAAIGAEVTVLAGLGVEHILGNALCSFFHAYPGGKQLGVGAHGDDRNI